MEPSVATSTCSKVSGSPLRPPSFCFQKFCGLPGGVAMRREATLPPLANAIAIILFVAHGKTFAWLLACFVRVFGGVVEGERGLDWIGPFCLPAPLRPPPPDRPTDRMSAAKLKMVPLPETFLLPARCSRSPLPRGLSFTLTRLILEKITEPRSLLYKEFLSAPKFRTSRS